MAEAAEERSAEQGGRDESVSGADVVAGGGVDAHCSSLGLDSWSQDDVMKTIGPDCLP